MVQHCSASAFPLQKFLSCKFRTFLLNEITLFFTYLTKKLAPGKLALPSNRLNLQCAMKCRRNWRAYSLYSQEFKSVGGGCDTDKKGDCFHSPVAVVAWLRNFVIHLRGVFLLNGRSRAYRCGIPWIISICQNDTEKSKKGQEFHVFFIFTRKGSWETIAMREECQCGDVRLFGW